MENFNKILNDVDKKGGAILSWKGREEMKGMLRRSWTFSTGFVSVTQRRQGELEIRKPNKIQGSGRDSEQKLAIDRIHRFGNQGSDEENGSDIEDWTRECGVKRGNRYVDGRSKGILGEKGKVGMGY
ncbi:OLC1v1036185C1 [Oldenlandia corymbosa var. corymbosa]|uniref:OLC1v1036185C1 n=1 Tax=Oldenlandia corymbosa var. corymbosa TaxID=529605 RepID=A0AAV1CVI0_OLDCO|nr:OLC1v1036185C1 [Oldenlandia corymbosa var. corymbosa]